MAAGGRGGLRLGSTVITEWTTAAATARSTFSPFR